MPRLPQHRPGARLEPKGRTLPFSFFPVRKTSRRFGLYDTMFAADPWAAMRGSAQQELTGTPLDEARAFLEQGQGFYEAARSGVSTRPLFLYYAFLNLGKALTLVRGYSNPTDKATHGLSHQSSLGQALSTTSVGVVQNPGKLCVFPEVVERLGYPRPGGSTLYGFDELIAQVVVGHRVWREGGNRSERFIGLDRIDFMHDSTELWLRLGVPKGDLSRYNVTRKDLLQKSGLATLGYREVAPPAGWPSEQACFEPSSTISYSGRPTDVVMNAVDSVRPHLWRIVTTVPNNGYRKYFVYLAPTGQQAIPQIASLWALFFFMGSVVRYQPHRYEELLNSHDGAFVIEFVSSQSDQLLYLLASEFCQREVARPAVA